MFCSNCGKKLDGNEYFCSNCGEKRLKAPEQISVSKIYSI